VVTAVEDRTGSCNYDCNQQDTVVYVNVLFLTTMNKKPTRCFEGVKDDAGAETAAIFVTA
jgi:hypothetical protein